MLWYLVTLALPLRYRSNTVAIEWDQANPVIPRNDAGGSATYYGAALAHTLMQTMI